MTQPPKAAGRSPDTAYDPRVAHEFFKAAGSVESVEKGATIFTERQKASRLLLQRDKMYLLLEGEVAIVASDKAIGTIRPGEIFGELAPLIQSARSATAVANTACRLIGLDDKQFLAGLVQKPEFALMLMALVIGRLRETIARLAASQSLGGDGGAGENAVFEAKVLRELAHELGDAAPLHVLRGQTILQEGGAGVLMYVVLEGRAAASIGGKLVERIGPGGVLGEIALVDQAPRVASAVAETDCSLLAINRRAFLSLVRSKPGFGASLLRALAARLRYLIAGAS